MPWIFEYPTTLTSEVSWFGTRGRNLTASALTLDERPFSKPDLRFGAAAERLNLPLLFGRSPGGQFPAPFAVPASSLTKWRAINAARHLSAAQRVAKREKSRSPDMSDSFLRANGPNGARRLPNA